MTATSSNATYARPTTDWAARKITCTERVIGAALACSEAAADLDASRLAAFGTGVVAALKELDLAHHHGTMSDVQAAARAVTTAVKLPDHAAGDEAADVEAFIGAVLYLRGQLHRLEEATLAVQEMPTRSPGPMQMQLSPGSVIQAWRLEGGIHIVFQVPEIPPPPHQLPEPNTVSYPHVQAAVEHIRALLECHDSDSPLLIVVTGLAGAGATTAALAFLTALTRDDRPDFHVQFDHDDTSPKGPDKVLFGLLADVGVPEDHIPPSPDEKVTWWRSLTAGKDPLILLDGAISAAQVRPLIPGSASVVVVTSRRLLSGLFIDGAHFVHVSPPSGEQPDDPSAEDAEKHITGTVGA